LPGTDQPAPGRSVGFYLPANPATESLVPATMVLHATRLTCPLCGFEHQLISLGPGESALCRRCDTVLARGSRFGRDATLVFTLTGLILAIPALFLPFIGAGKFGQEHGGLLLTGVEGLWDNRMRLLAIWVLLCGTAVPVALLGILAGYLLPERLGWAQNHAEILSRAAHAMAYWAIPEVQMLAVLVALMKLGSLVNVTIGAGFWAYAGMSFSLLLAWRSFVLLSPVLLPAAAGPAKEGSPSSS
jgi:paraquat-inducible protein A